MSKKLTYLLGILATILIGTYFYWKLCCCNCEEKSSCKQKGKVEKTTKTPKGKALTSLPFSVKDVDGNLSLKVSDNFNFKTSSSDFVRPISTSLQTGVLKLKDYLMSNEGKSLSIKGFYTSTEKNNSIYPNLGLARANAIKNYFTSKGITTSLIDTFGELRDNLVANEEEIFLGPVELTVANAKDNTDNLKELANKIKANPLVLYFKTGQASINLTPEQRQKIADISKYLDKVDNAKCLIIGHTDNEGSLQTNIRLGKNRADFTRGYLVKNGIADGKITTDSKGPNEPIADNATEEGRAKNRRTVITIQNN